MWPFCGTPHPHLPALTRPPPAPGSSHDPPPRQTTIPLLLVCTPAHPSRSRPLVHPQLHCRSDVRERLGGRKGRGWQPFEALLALIHPTWEDLSPPRRSFELSREVSRNHSREASRNNSRNNSRCSSPGGSHDVESVNDGSIVSTSTTNKSILGTLPMNVLRSASSHSPAQVSRTSFNSACTTSEYESLCGERVCSAGGSESRRRRRRGH